MSYQFNGSLLGYLTMLSDFYRSLQKFLHVPRTGLLPAINGVECAVEVTKETMKVFSFLDSPLCKRGMEGYFYKP